MIRVVASFLAGWDMGVITKCEYILYVIAALSMGTASVTKTVFRKFIFKIHIYFTFLFRLAQITFIQLTILADALVLTKITDE